MSTVETFSVECEPVQEAVADLVRAHKALGSRRGPIYRRLERDIEDRAEAILELRVAVRDLGEGYYIAIPPEELVSLLKRARALRLL